FRRIESEIINEVESIEGLNEYKSLFEPYISTFTNNSFKESIASTFTAKEAELIRTQIGKPAPNFTLQSNLGNSHSLKDFKGKVVYLDLWASWCGPCREETPSFKLLYDKYKNDNRIAFIGIAVHNGINEWKKALEIDKPEWLQLFDKDETVWKAYVANWIPKFILIDKQGNIVNFDAPRPSDGKKLEELLKQEMAK
ncbi:MAG: TlpA family protein disulfide reductase, partial [Rhizobium sp.]|nr:TlpA family protein disulfide reductase [Rhizobium sp.]